MSPTPVEKPLTEEEQLRKNVFEGSGPGPWYAYPGELAVDVFRGAAGTTGSSIAGTGRSIENLPQTALEMSKLDRWLPFLDEDVRKFAKMVWKQNVSRYTSPMKFAGEAIEQGVSEQQLPTPATGPIAESIATGVGSTLPGIVAAVAGGPAGIAAFAGTAQYENTYKLVKEMKGTDRQARAFGLVSGLVGAITEPSFGVERTVLNVLKKADDLTEGWVVKNIFKTIKGEAAEEIIQEMPDEVARQAYTKDRTFWDSLGQLATAGLLGGTVGMLLGGPVAAMQFWSIRRGKSPAAPEDVAPPAPPSPFGGESIIGKPLKEKVPSLTTEQKFILLDEVDRRKAEEQDLLPNRRFFENKLGLTRGMTTDVRKALVASALQERADAQEQVQGLRGDEGQVREAAGGLRRGPGEGGENREFTGLARAATEGQEEAGKEVTAKQPWFHASHETLSELKARPVESIDSLGTWVEGNKDVARKFYGPKVVEVLGVSPNLLDASSQTMDETLFQNESLFRRLFPDEPIETFKEFTSIGLKKRNPEAYRMRTTYLRAFRQMLQDANYDGIVWRNSRIDTGKGDPSHDVAVLFNTAPLPVKAVDVQAKASAAKQPWEMTRTEHMLWERGLPEVATAAGSTYREIGDLPPVAPGKVRVFHGTNPENIRGIVREGIRTGRESGKAGDEPFVFGYSEPRGEFGAARVVADVPAADADVSQGQVRVRRAIKPEEIVAITKGEKFVDPVDSWKRHKAAVQEAVREGKPVSAEVLADYPDLQAKAPVPTPVAKELPPEATRVPEPDEQTDVPGVRVESAEPAGGQRRIFYHFSPVSGLTELDSARFGENILTSREEARRVPQVAAFGLGGEVETGFGPESTTRRNAYMLVDENGKALPESQLYDFAKDPDKMLQKMSFRRAESQLAAEGKYRGWWLSSSKDTLFAGQGRFFGKVKVKEIAPEKMSTRSIIFASFNTKVGLTEPEVLEQLNSTWMRKAGGAVRSVVGQFFRKHIISPGIGHWIDGQETTFAVELEGYHDADTIEYIASNLGLIGRQKAELIFNIRPGGPDHLYMADFTGLDPDDLYKGFKAMGIPDLTVVKLGNKPDTLRVYVSEQGAPTLDQIFKSTVDNYKGTNVQFVRGGSNYLEAVGNRTRSDYSGRQASARLFEEKSNSYERNTGRQLRGRPRYHYWRPRGGRAGAVEAGPPATTAPAVTTTGPPAAVTPRPTKAPERTRVAREMQEAFDITPENAEVLLGIMDSVALGLGRGDREVYYKTLHFARGGEPQEGALYQLEVILQRWKAEAPEGEIKGTGNAGIFFGKFRDALLKLHREKHPEGPVHALNRNGTLNMANIKKAATNLVKYLRPWLEEFGRGLHGYYGFSEAERLVMAEMFPEFSNKAHWKLFRLLLAAISPGNPLDKNVKMASGVWSTVRGKTAKAQEKRLRDGYQLPVDEEGRFEKPVLVKAGYDWSGRSATNNLRTAQAIWNLVAQNGGGEKGIAWLLETTSSDKANLNTIRVASGVGFSAKDSFNDILVVVEDATGQSEVVPRLAAVAGPKVLPYAMNLLGFLNYTAQDVWESRLVSSHFLELLKRPDELGKTKTGAEKTVVTAFDAPEDTKAGILQRKIFLAFTGEVARQLNLDKADAQAARWFYVLAKLAEMGYTKSQTSKSMVEYMEDFVATKKSKKAGSKVLSQEILGKIVASHEMQATGERVIRNLQNAKLEDLLHEVGHDFIRILPLLDPELADAVANNVGATSYDALTREQHEYLANAHTAYIREGIAPNATLKAYFDKFAEWLMNIYRSLVGTNLENKLNPELREYFARMYRFGEQFEKSAEAPPQAPAARSTQLPPPRGPTSIQNAVVDAERVKRGLRPAMEVAERSFATVWEEAMQVIDRNPVRQDALIRDLADNPRSVSDLEDALLLHRQVTLQNRYSRVMEQMEAAEEQKNDSEMSILQQEEQVLSNELLQLYDINKAVGTATGRGLNARKMLANEDFTLAKMLAQRRAVAGGRLTPEASAEAKAAHEKIADLQRKLDEALEKLEAKSAEQAVAEVIEEEVQAQRKPRRAPSEKTVTARKEVKDAWKELAAEFTGKVWSISPDILAPAIKLARAYYNLKVVTWADFFKRVVLRVGPEKAAKAKHVFKAAWDQVTKDVMPTTPADLGDVKAMTRYARELVKHFVLNDVHGVDPIIDAVHAEMLRVVPAITRRAVMDLISGYGQYTQLDQDAVAAEIRDLTGQMQQMAKLYDIAAGIPPKKTGKEHRTMSDEERRLVQQVEEAKRSGTYVVTDPATQLKTPLDKIITRLRHQIADLEKQIATKTRIVKKRTGVVRNAEANMLAAKRDALRQQLDALVPRRGVTDEQRLATWKSRVRNRIEHLEDRIKRNDFSPEVRRPVPLDPEAEKLRFKLEEAKVNWQIALEKERRRNRTVARRIFETGVEFLQFTRTVLTAWDLSATMRQGGMWTAAHPIKALRAFGMAWKALRDPEVAARIENEIANRPNAKAGYYARAKLYFSEPGGILSKQEEVFRSNLARLIPGVRASERHFTTFLNLARADWFDSLVASLPSGGAATEAQMRVIASFVNQATGRGDLGKLAAAADALSVPFFAFRYQVSRFQLLTGRALRMQGSDAETRRVIAKEYARALMGIGSFLGIATFALSMMFGAPGDDWGIELDPRSSDFAKLRIGRTRIDPWFGLQQATVFLSRLSTLTRKSVRPHGGGRKTSIWRPKYGQKSAWDVTTNLIRTKLAPVPGAVVNALSGKDVVGRKVTALTVGRDLLVPISAKDVYDSLTGEGVGEGVFSSMMNILGMGVQTYGTED